MVLQFAPGQSRPRLTHRQRELFEQLAELYLAEGFAHLTLEETATRLRCSKSTIYALAASREQLVSSVVVGFFRDAATRVDAKVDAEADPLKRIEVYLLAVSEELKAASATFMDDVAAFAPARETYELNTRIAAGRVHELILEGVEHQAMRDVPAAFVADIVSSSMVRIQQGAVRRETGLDDATAYLELAQLVVHGIGRDAR